MLSFIALDTGFVNVVKLYKCTNLFIFFMIKESYFTCTLFTTQSGRYFWCNSCERKT